MKCEPDGQRRGILCALVCASLGSVDLAAAQSGERPLKFIVPTSPGSAADTAARFVGEQIQTTLGRPVLIENKAGAGGALAAAHVAAAEPNGETIGLLGNSYLLFPVEFLQHKFDPIRDVVPVAMISKGMNVLLVANESPYRKLEDIVRKARAEPGNVAYASAGVGSSTFHSAQRVVIAANIDVIHLPFKGSPQSLSEVVASRVDFAFAPISVAAPLLRSGRVRAIAVSSSKRSVLLPDVPTTVEAGVPGSSYESWLVAIVPSKTPAAIQAELNRIFSTALETPEVRRHFGMSGVEPVPMPLAQLRAFVLQEHASALAYDKVAKRH
jgi:tripartite-type tricarboxylate transporter receptor subunit TctC